jgi:hypothetical protein
MDYLVDGWTDLPLPEVFEPILEVHLEQSLPWGYFVIVTLATVHDSLLQKHVGALDFAKLATTPLK